MLLGLSSYYKNLGHLNHVLTNSFYTDQPTNHVLGWGLYDDLDCWKYVPFGTKMKTLGNALSFWMDYSANYNGKCSFIRR